MNLRNQLTILCLICASFLACNGTDSENSKPLIVTTTGIIADCVEQIVGDRAEVISIMGPGVDPHLYKASQGDLSKLTRADIIIYNGLHLEGKMGEVLKKTGETKMSLAVGDFADPSKLKKIDKQSDLRDPHIWFDPDLWMECMHGLSEQLASFEGLEGLDSSFAVYKAEVMAKQKELRVLLDNNLTVDQRILITSHDAFSYFGDAFNFQVRGLQGISTAAEYGVKDVKDLIEYIIANEIKAIFIETSVSDKNLRSVAEGAAAQNFEVEIGGALYSDALGDADGPAATYTTMLEQNVKTIIDALK